MKYLKWPLIILVVLALLYGGLCAIGPKNFNTVRSTTMNAPPTLIYNIVNDYETWSTWSDWEARDPSMVSTLGDKTVGVGASSSWTGKDGKGEMKMLESVKGERIKNQLNFEGFDGNSYGVWAFKDEGEGKTKVSWAMESDKDLPFIMRGMMFVVGAVSGMEKSFDNGLANIKVIAEERALNKSYGGYKIVDTATPEKHYVMSRSEVNTNMIKQFYTNNLGALFSKVQGGGLESDGGMPSCLFFKMDDRGGKADMAVAIPVTNPMSIPGLSTLTIPERRALTIDFYGDNTDTSKAHDAMKQYLKDQDLLYDSPVVEEYVTDPSTEKDVSKWLTKITYYPVE